MMFSNAEQSIPYVFHEIMKSDDRRAEIKEHPVVSFYEYRELRRDRARLREAAVRILKWVGNHTKGN